MNRSRETYFEALVQLMQAGGVFKLVSRRVKMWHECNVDQDFPALFIMSPSEQYTREVGEGVPSRTIIDITLMIYLSGANDISSGAIPMIDVNNALDEIERIIAPSPLTQVQTLGGLVRHLWIEGEIIKEPGDMDGEGIIVVPLKMLVP